MTDAALTRLANPVVRRLLRSPLHRLLGGVALLEYTGRRSGRALAVPVSVLRDDDDLILISRRRRRWWRNFRRPWPVTLTLRGGRFDGRAVVVDASPQEVAGLLARLSPRAGKRGSDARAADRVVIRVEVERNG